jgi:hypothetical protein
MNTYTCFQCGVEFYRYSSHEKKSKSGRFYCSSRCAAIVNNRGKRTIKKCLDCGKEIRKRSTRCRECLYTVLWKTKVVTCNCGRVYILDRAGRRRGHGTTQCNSCTANKNRVDKKLRAIEYKGGKCLRCGYSRCSRSLAFHHRDRKEKQFEIGQFMNRSWETLRRELDKCDLLCHNCHCEVEDEIVKSRTSPSEDRVDNAA